MTEKTKRAPGPYTMGPMPRAPALFKTPVEARQDVRWPTPSCEAIRERRMAHGLTQQASATLLKVNTVTFNRWERGHIRMPAGFWDLFCLKTRALAEVRAKRALARAVQGETAMVQAYEDYVSDEFDAV